MKNAGGARWVRARRADVAPGFACAILDGVLRWRLRADDRFLLVSERTTEGWA